MKHIQFTTKITKGMEDVGSSNVSHVSRKSLQCVDVNYSRRRSYCRSHVLKLLQCL